jgi:carboxypeptidase T
MLILVNISHSSQFKVKIHDKAFDLPSKFNDLSEKLDTNKDGTLQNSELKAHVLGDKISLDSFEGQDRIQEYKCKLTGAPNPNAKDYHSFEQMEKVLDQAVLDHPDIAKKVSLGKSAEGRDIWALKVTGDVHTDTSHKSGIVVTGCHHAREWMTVEAPLQLIHDITDNPDSPENQRRLAESELWIVPVANPDGYEFSRNENSWWRKNRRPLGVDQSGEKTSAIGVDLNRNYWDGKDEHLFVYRPAGDTPGNTRDDFSATSDNPRRDTYRGPFGGSEPEVKALLDFELSHSNIKGVLDYHSYGDVILYPYGHTRKESPNTELYREIGTKMQEATSGFRLEQSVGLYPASGTSDDTHDLNGILNFTIEMGRSFQPNPKTIPVTSGRVSKASQAFIDEIIARDDAGELPKHSAEVA